MELSSWKDYLIQTFYVIQEDTDRQRRYDSLVTMQANFW